MNTIFPGSFDPFHEGHLYILKKGLKKFDNITIIVANNCKKKSKYSLEYRQNFIINQLKLNNINNVSVIILNEKYLADYMKKNNIKKYIRGIRNLKDFIYEIILWFIYKKRNKKVSLCLFKSNKKNKKVSSTTLKNVNSKNENEIIYK